MRCAGHGPGAPRAPAGGHRGGAYHHPMRARTLLTPGQPAWRHLEEEQRALLRPAPGTSTEELLRRGMHLSREAARLRGAIRQADDERPTAS